MRASDVISDVQQVTGYSDQATNFSRMSDAVECLANKGLIDAMQGYLEIPTTSSRIVTLPRDIETPIKVNVGNSPSFGRTKLFEFSMNGPGDTYTPTDWAWEDRGQVPCLVQPTSATTVRAVSTSASDATSGSTMYTVRIWGRLAPVAPNTLGQEVSETIILNGTSQASATVSPPLTTPPNTSASPYAFASITRVLKSPTAGSVTLSTSGGTVLSIYAPDETEPEYRQIRLSKSGTTAHILFRRSVYRISTLNDWIPVQSRMGLLMMLRANEFYRKSTAADLQTGAMLEKQAEKFVEEEQKSRNAFSEVASATEQDAVHGLNINSSDSLIVADIYDDVAKMVGPIGKPKVFDRITEAIELLDHKGQWESSEGYVDLSLDSSGIVTLPRYVDTPLAINIGNGPSKMRNRWFEFHLNGPGSSAPMPYNSWEDHGDAVTITDLTEAQGLIYKPDSSADNGKTLTVYGYDANDRDITIVLTGNSTNAFANISTSLVKRISRISRDATSGSAQLIAYTSDGNTATQLGYYYSDETLPSYRRVRLSAGASWIRMRYRKRSTKISSLYDPIHLRSRLAILAAVGSLQAMRAEKPDFQSSEILEKKALQYLSEEKSSRNPNGTWSIQIDTKTWGASPEHGQW